MSDQGKRKKKNKTIRILEDKAREGDINALYQLAIYYEQGQFVEKDIDQAEVYFNKTVDAFNGQTLTISSLTLFNFRAFDNLSMNLAEDEGNNLIVILGDNGAGKTTLLDSLSISLSWLINRITTRYGVGDLIRPFDIKSKSSIEYASIITNFSIGSDIQYEVELSKSKKSSGISRKNYLQEIGQLADIYKLANSRDKRFNYPIMAYYSVERSLEINKKDVKTFDGALNQKPWDKFDGYSKSLNGKADFRLFFRWFKDLEDIDNAKTDVENFDLKIDNKLLKELEKLSSSKTEIDKIIASYIKKKKSEINTLKTEDLNERPDAQASRFIHYVTKAVYAFMPGFSKLRIQRTPTLDMLINKGDVTLSVLQLSQGEKSLLALVADIARRMVLLNPSLDNPLEGKGIVLIDEIDLHLHPAWQQKIVPNLLSTFPEIQFIVTTHSPQVVTTVNAKCIRVLRDGRLYNAPKGSKGAKSSRILKRLFEVDVRPPDDENTKLLSSYLNLVYSDKWEKPEAISLREQLDIIYADEEPDLTKADLYIESREWELDIEKNQ